MMPRVLHDGAPAQGDRTSPKVSRHDERGSAAIEVVLLVPALMLLLMFAVAGGRVSIARGSVEQAAADAARAASLARTASDAQTTALEAARATLANQGLTCTSMSVTLDTTGFATPVGAPGNVAATVSCAVRLTDLAIPGLSDRVVTATLTSPLDVYRARR
jgi:Flp pilus assembly protein TadG